MKSGIYAVLLNNASPESYWLSTEPTSNYFQDVLSKQIDNSYITIPSNESRKSGKPVPSKPKNIPAKGGSVTRDANSSRFVEVRTSKGAAKASPKSQSTVKEASSKRNAALKRLADR